MLKLYGSAMSTCTKRVAMTLHEKCVPFEFIPVDLKGGETKTPQYLEKQPFGQIPYINDDGFILYESRAICRYICCKYPEQGTKELIPRELEAHALFEQAASVEQSNFDKYASAAVYEKIFKPMMGGKTDDGAFRANIEMLSKRLDGYEAILGKQKYLGGNELTLADLFHLPYGTMLAAADSNIMEQKPNVSRWFKSLVGRPSWKAVDGGVKSISKY